MSSSSQRASLRQGTHAVKNRSDIEARRTQPWRQKELDVLVKVLSALHNGVVVVSCSAQLLVHMLKLPRKVRRLALKSVYSEKLLKTNSAVDSLSFTAPKTAEFAKCLASCTKHRHKVLVILLEEGNEFACTFST